MNEVFGNDTSTVVVGLKVASAAIDLGNAIIKEMIGVSITASRDMEGSELMAATLSTELQLN